MKEFTTENGTTLYYEVNYQLGGFNYFTGKNDPRCYTLNINKNPQEFAAFSDLNDESGAVRVDLFEVGRQSKKQLAKAQDMALGKLKEFLNNQYSNL